MSYKKEQETFVSNNEGTPVVHITVSVIACVLSVYVRDVLDLYRSKSNRNNRWFTFLLDFLLLIVPLQLLLTVYSDLNSGVVCLCVIILLFLFLCTVQLQKYGASNSGSEKVTFGNIAMGNKRSFITYYRALVNILTAFSILAVDFKIFPRYFGKTETFGTGLMDMGVGAYLVSNAIVSGEARGVTNTDQMFVSIVKSVKASLPLWFLGVVRLLAVKGIDYQEHVTEYGVHWNFFFTLAFVRVLCTVLFCCLPRRFWNVASVAIIALYQHSLKYNGLTDYLINGEDGRGGRGDLFDANREGIFSCAGYLSLYILAVQVGRLLMKERSMMADWIKTSIHLLITCIAAWAMYHYSVVYVQPVSRRFANLPYMLWMLAFNSLILMALLVMDIMLTYVRHVRALSNVKATKKTDHVAPNQEEDQTCLLASAVNYNGLAYFLLANLLTGIVNLTIKTLYQSNFVAMVILTLYMLVLSLVSVALYEKKVRLKYW